MRKFKHKSSGRIAQLNDSVLAQVEMGKDEFDYIPTWAIENSNDWEEVIEKGYEILSFITTSPPINIVLRRLNNHDTFGMYHAGEKELLKSSIHKIHSVKRLPDSEVFTLGDWIDFGDDENHKITSFGYKDKDETNFWGFYNDKDGYGTQFFGLKNQKKPLFITVDGVKIHKGDEYWLVSKDFRVCYCSSFSEADLLFSCFSSRNLAEQHAIMNKPYLSIQDIVYGTKDTHPPHAFVNDSLMDYFKKLVNSKK